MKAVAKLTVAGLVRGKIYPVTDLLPEKHLLEVQLPGGQKVLRHMKTFTKPVN